jgi:hypothetical protein
MLILISRKTRPDFNFRRAICKLTDKDRVAISYEVNEKFLMQK